MTKGEREDLLRLVRERERALKLMAEQRSADLMADFESQMAAIYHWSQDSVWEDAKDEAERAIKKAQHEIEERCRELGIPPDYAPTIGWYWAGRGANAVKDRQTELRRAAKKRVEAIEARALAMIAADAVAAKTEILSHGLISDNAKAFLGSMKPLEEAMPQLVMADVEKLAGQQKLQSRAIERRYLQ